MVERSTAEHLYLVRHGRAEDDHPGGDDARALTAPGREDFRALARELAGELRLAGIATSPLVRAVQTAEILAEACGVDEVLVRDELAYPRASAAGIEALARKLGPGWALVGHNPSLGMALAHLLELDEEPSFRKGAVAALVPGTRWARPWRLDWVVSPGRARKNEL